MKQSVQVGNNSGFAETLARFQDRHSTSAIVICGCGESLNLLQHPERFVTIGVNDVGRCFQPNYLVVVNPRNQFKADRFKHVAGSKAEYVFTQMRDLGISHPRVVQFRLGKYGGTDFSDPNVLHYTRNSPYVALCLAVHMGARRIGLIGVDFTDDHFFAKTGRHPLARQLEQIDREYTDLARACHARGIEIVNLSPTSRLTAFPRMDVDEFAPAARARPIMAPVVAGKCFVVNYRFLSCGDVFADGLRHAAAQLGCAIEEAFWDDPQLPDKVRRFQPDVLFVIHGRRFIQRWRDRFRDFNTAVWLVDEPYEVDDTSRWSRHFKTVFVNDPATVERHRNAHYLPVCFDPRVHRHEDGIRRYGVGFVGGFNAARERHLLALAEAKALDYVVGGPWRAPALQGLCIASNVSSECAAELYRETRIVVNVFRETHHYNRNGIPATSMNPRIYEALACGAAVVTEPRPEISEVFPGLPVFRTPEELVAVTANLLNNDRRRDEVVSVARAQLEGHSYAARLRRVFELALTGKAEPADAGVPAPSPRTTALSTVKVCDSATASNSNARSLHLVPGRRAVSVTPFDGIPRRNLLYHVWPARGSIWRWNIEQLLHRIDLFNGRRIVSIAHDAQSEAPEAVMELLAGHGCEFLVIPNDPRGEAAAFPGLLEAIRCEGGNQVTFYGHAKGVRHEPKFPAPLKKWVESLYQINLDDWASVRAQLDRWPMTGAFRLRGRFRVHQNLGDWHYSGTFFWFRNDSVFCNQDPPAVPDFYFGVEVWPGLLFRADETGCLGFDNPRRIPYDERFWRDYGDRTLAEWRRRRLGPKPPADLVKPLPYDGFDHPRLEQIPDEFDWWVNLLLREEPASLLTIGAGHGGVEWHVARKFRERDRDIAITCVDRVAPSEFSRSFDDIRKRFGQRVDFVQGDSGRMETIARLGKSFDAVFIDADHGFRSVDADFALALGKNAKIIGLHDIVDSDWHAASKCCVSRLWRSLVRNYETREHKSGAWGGIGVVWPHRRRDAAPGGREPHRTA